MKKALILLLVAFYVFLGIHFQPWTAFTEGGKISEIIFASVAMLTLAGLIAGYLGLFFGKKADALCLFFNIIYILLGCITVYIFWTLWIFETPTFLKRVTHSLPAFILGICLPAALVYYHTRRDGKA